jgi:hypothetical protein
VSIVSVALGLCRRAITSSLTQAALMASVGLLSGQAMAQVAEAPEIVFSTEEARPLREKAAELKTAVAMFEYVHNTIEYVPYHGSRSGSVNTFLGRRGNDVDMASTLIAMLRSRNIPSRYVVGVAQLAPERFTNWLGVGSVNVGAQLLRDQGIQSVTTSASSVAMERVWVEVLVPFDQYRGVDLYNAAVDCSQAAQASLCRWLPVDPALKQRRFGGLAIDPSSQVSFNYTAYYEAIKNNDATRRDKNPLAILEEQLMSWLRTNQPGRTLEDIADSGTIVPLTDGLLPTSLPYSVLGGGVLRYDTVAAHDAALPRPKQWNKLVTVTNHVCDPDLGGAPVVVGTATLNLVDLATKKLTSKLVSLNNSTQQVWLHGSEAIGGGYFNAQSNISFVCPDGALKTLQPGMQYWISVEMDGAPGVGTAADQKIKASYIATIGGHYLVATGGETSNWSQVHRASDLLLDVRNQFPIIYPTSESNCDVTPSQCTPYLDMAPIGVFGSEDKLLSANDADTIQARAAYTEGLLYVASSLYFARLREQFERGDRLMKTRTPIRGFLGVVSSVGPIYDVGNETSFSVLPSGLLIDMKGISIGGSYRAEQTALTYSNSQIEFLAHIASSLEHEIWQELTGYDAVSTVRGIQMALANGATLANPKRNTSEDSFPALLTAQGFGPATTAGHYQSFSYEPYTVFNRGMATWRHITTDGASFDTLIPSVSGSTRAMDLGVARYQYLGNAGLYAWVRCFSQQYTALNSAVNSGLGPYGYRTQLCGTAAPVTDTYANHLANLRTLWDQSVVPLVLGQPYVDYFDRNMGFSTGGGRLYRTQSAASDPIDVLTLGGIRNDLYLRDVSQSWVEYLIPSKQTVGSTFRFSVDIRKEYQTSNGRLLSMSMEIDNLSAGGGFVEAPKNVHDVARQTDFFQP